MTAAKAFALFVATILTIALLVAAIWAIRYYTAEVRGVISGEEQIESAPSRISRYEHFFDLCASVQTQKAALAAQRDRLERVTDDGVRDRIESNIAGLTTQVARTVNRYNAEASKDYTSARFRASNLPYQLSTEGDTTCAQ
ncbi:hypothetical protein [Thioalkalivibrio sp. ALE12]|uniref:hypothetical protein n=1 Tax=Thioalkalivibrio sp. ALE12 TaxID=1158170 RepID=UPI0003745C98|nr:hypothetical protein [Thioalkalivibrio sp. ALE12]